MAPFISGCFGAIIYSLIKYVVHVRKDPVKWAVFTSPFFFLIAGTVCSLSIVYKGSPRLGLADKPAWFIASVSLGTGFGLAILAGLFFVPWTHAKVIKRDHTLTAWDVFYGPLLFNRPAPVDAQKAKVPNYAVIQHGADDDRDSTGSETDASSSKEKDLSPETDRENIDAEHTANFGSQADYKLLMVKAREEHHAELRRKRTPLGWAMRRLHNNPVGAGSSYELHNMKAYLMRLPAFPVVALFYGMSYDIHRSQVGILGTPEGKRMARVYSQAPKYPNEVEFLYSYVQVITACTASFAHGANDVGNAVGVWAAMYSAWSTGTASAAKNPVPLWQIAVMALTICIGFITYGYNIMKGTHR